MSQLKVLVLGGTGFVGRYAVAALISAGANVIVGTRQPGSATDRLALAARSCPQRQSRLEALTRAEDWHELIEDVDVVLNCVGILRQRNLSTYDNVHHLAPTALAAACCGLGKRLVHVSALGLDRDARSRFISSKLDGEAGIKKSNADWIIAKPSLLDGPGGFGAHWLRMVSRLPAFFTLSGVQRKIAALDVEDLGDALAKLCIATEKDLALHESREFELGGLREFEFHEYIRALRKTYTNSSSYRIPVPNQLARLFAHFFDVIHFTPFSFGHWELLQRDNIPRVNRLPELLSRPPRPAASVAYDK